jgi:hypothetical protein
MLSYAPQGPGKSLNSKLKLHSIEWNKRVMNRLSKSYIFLYSDHIEDIPKDMKLELNISFSPEAVTQDAKQVIYNFGYSIGVEIWDQKLLAYNWISESKYGYSESGKETKKYLSDKQSREVMNGLIQKYIRQTLSTFDIPNIVRGPLSKFKQTSKRYANIDNIIQEFCYIKYIIKAKDLLNNDSYIPIAERSEDNETDEYWFYSKQPTPPRYFEHILEY